jgi:nitrite reductase/ring-hydroxylating ferredoxin subunit
MRLLLVFSSLSAAYSFLNGHHLSVPSGYLTTSEYVSARSSVNKRSNCAPYTPAMAIKSSDKDKSKQPKDQSGGGMGRFIPGIFRNDKEEEPEEEEDEIGFLKSISKRLSFRRESEPDPVNGQKVSENPAPLSLINFPFPSSEVGNSNAGEYQKDTKKRLQELRKEMESNQKRQKEIEEQTRRDMEQEKEAKKQAEIIANQIAKLEAEQKREEAREKEELEKKKKQEIEGKKKQQLEALTKEELEKKKIAQVTQQQPTSKKDDDSEEDLRAKKRKSTTSVFMKFVSKVGKNVANTAAKAFGDEEEWVVIMPKTRMSPGEIVPVQIRGIDLLVVGSKDGKIHCLANSCSHLGTPLETGALVSRPKEDANANMLLTDTVPPQIEKEDCIVCPLHHTAFALESGEVRGEWCPYPPIIGNVMGSVKVKSPVGVFDLRTRGKNIEVRINSLVRDDGDGPEPKRNS